MHISKGVARSVSTSQGPLKEPLGLGKIGPVRSGGSRLAAVGNALALGGVELRGMFWRQPAERLRLSQKARDLPAPIMRRDRAPLGD